MKRMKKAFALMLAMVMTMAMAVPSFAVEGDGEGEGGGTTVQITVPRGFNTTNNETHTDGSIEIKGIHQPPAGDDHTDHTTEYKVYKMLHLDSYNPDFEAYKYKIVADWYEFFTSGEGQHYVAIDEDGFVTWSPASDKYTVVTFTKEALQYAEAKSIPVVTSHNTAMKDENNNPIPYYHVEGANGKFENLTLGYYLVTSNVGALCGLTTTQPAASINAKNTAPTIDKEVQEDFYENSSTASWFTSNDADIGQYVKFEISVDAQAGALNYVLHDAMDPGFTFNDITETVNDKTVKHGIHSVVLVGRGSEDIDLIGGAASTLSENETFDIENHTAYQLVLNPHDATPAAPFTDNCVNCDFHIVFHQYFLDTLTSNESIVVTYDAQLNENANIGGPSDPSTAPESADYDKLNTNSGNHNSTWLTYGGNHHTTKATTTTYTYGFEIVKTDPTYNLLPGAEFSLYPADKSEPIHFLVKNGVYYRCDANQEGSTITVPAGHIKVVGLDRDTYYLRETKAPNGYNIMTTDTEVTFLVVGDSKFSKNMYATITNDGGVEKYSSSGGGINVINSKGLALPETGGMGTVMFITCGSIVVMAAGVLLVTKKRMSMIQD